MNCGTPGCPCWYSARSTWKRGPVLRADDTEVDIVISRRDEPGIGRGLSHHDKYRVWLALERKGYSAAQTARTLGIASRTVVRWRGGVRTLENV